MTASGSGLVERLRMIRGTQFTPIENALVTEAADRIEELTEALEKIRRRAAPHVDDTAEDRQRDLFHVDAIAASALAKVTHNPQATGAEA